MSPSLSEKDPVSIAVMFDAIAGRYDLLNRLISGGLDQRWRRRAIRALRLTGRETLLDVCTGTADVAIAAARGGAARVIGIDFAHEMLRLGLRKVGERRIHLVRGDAAQLPLESGSVDAATIAFGIRNVQHPAEACRELARVLRPGGRLAILEFAVPATRVGRGLYVTYTKHVLPRIGRLVSRHGQAYSYLPASIGSFPEPPAFALMLAAAGFVDVASVPLTFGIVYLYTASRGN